MRVKHRKQLKEKQNDGDDDDDDENVNGANGVTGDPSFFFLRLISFTLRVPDFDAVTEACDDAWKKNDVGRYIEYQRLNDIAHIYQALSAANS